MGRIRSAWYLTGIVLLLTGCASTPPGPRGGEGLPNFDQVEARLLYRGAQPLPEGFAELTKLRIATIVDLRGPGEKPPTREAEKRAAQDEHIEYFPEPMPGLHAPDRKAMSRVLSVIDDPQKQPVFVHCKRGADRTGTVVAIYRITHDCWTAEQAIQEARAHGMSWVEFGMRRFIRDWYEEVKAQGCVPGRPQAGR